MNELSDTSGRPRMDREEARTRTERAKRHFAALAEELLEVRDREGWRALGYGSFSGYIAREIGRASCRERV